MGLKMTPAGLERAAKTIGCDVPALKAVLAVEATGSGFFPDGRPKILFERHKFHKYTNGRFDTQVPALSNPAAGGYIGGIAEYGRLYEALQLDAEAAIRATSWGIGQILGDNWHMCGEKSLYGFLLAMHNNEDAQLALMAQFILSSGASGPLIRHDWAGFAKIYNGPNFAKGHYDMKLAVAFKQAVR